MGKMWSAGQNVVIASMQILGPRPMPQGDVEDGGRK